MELPELKGYLRKKSRTDKYQRRYFEATTHYLTYYKSRESEKLLACIDLWRTQEIALNPNDPERVEFTVQIGEQSYLLRADTPQEAEKWINGLRTRQHRPEGVPSDAYSVRSERIDAESDVSSEYSVGGTRTSVTGNPRKYGATPSMTFTDSSINPIIPNADAINSAKATGYNLTLTPTVQNTQHEEDPGAMNAPCCCTIM